MTEQIQAFPITFNYRNTRMGGQDDVILMSFTKGSVIRSFLHKTQTGSHGERTYRLLPGKYLFWRINVSNAGNVYVSVGILDVLQDGKYETKYETYLYYAKAPTGKRIPEKWLELINKNKGYLPFSELVFGDGD
jgi:hypothetical protein